MVRTDDERRNMSDREIVGKYKKKQVMDMLYKYKDTFSLRDEIGTCPNIEVEIEITDKSPFCIRPYIMLRKKIRIYWTRK